MLTSIKTKMYTARISYPKSIMRALFSAPKNNSLNEQLDPQI